MHWFLEYQHVAFPKPTLRWSSSVYTEILSAIYVHMSACVRSLEIFTTLVLEFFQHKINVDPTVFILQKNFLPFFHSFFCQEFDSTIRFYVGQ